MDNGNGAGDVKKAYGARKKESALQRRQRRLRADTRVFARIVAATQVADVHHSASSHLYGWSGIIWRS